MLKKLKITWLVSFAIIFTPFYASAGVSINEVAWMGTPENADAEWIELYNSGAETVSLDGAILYEEFGLSTQRSLVVLSGSVAPGGYYVFSRATTTFSVDLIKKFDSGRGLSNSGESLGLVDATGARLDAIDMKTKWQAGDDDKTKNKTMQLVAGEWVTALGTPRATNSAPQDIDEPSPVDTTSVSSSSSESDSVVLSSHSSPASLSTTVRPPEITASAGRGRLALVGTPISFEEKLFDNVGANYDGGNVTWSFGDGASATGQKIVHSYKFPGDYVVVMNVLKGAENYVSRTSVRVVPASLVITEVAGDFVKIKNQSSFEANLGGWSLVADRGLFIFPVDTIILPGKEVTFSADVVGRWLNVVNGDVRLVSPVGTTVATPMRQKVEVAIASTTIAIAPEPTKTEEVKVLPLAKVATPVVKKLAATPKPTVATSSPTRIVIGKPKSLLSALFGRIKNLF